MIQKNCALLTAAEGVQWHIYIIIRDCTRVGAFPRGVLRS